MTNQKEAYIGICKKYYIPLQSQYWWLDIVCGKDGWEVCFVYNKSGEIIGTLPYPTSRYKGFRVIKMPPLTSHLNIWMNHPTGPKQSHRQTYEHRILHDLISQLPKAWYFDQNFTLDFQNWLPFYWNGFKQTTRYSYIINNEVPLETIFKKFNRNARRNIFGAKEQVNIVLNENLPGFYKIIKNTFARQHKTLPFSQKLFEQLDEALAQRNQRKLYLAYGKNKELHAGIYMIWDDQVATCLLSGIDPNFNKDSALFLLFRQAIQDFHDKVKTFDFEGSMIQNVEFVFRSLGAVQRPYHRIYKSKSPLLDLLISLIHKK